MPRYLAVAYLDSFITTDDGDKFGKGEFYFKVKSEGGEKRYPDKGEIRLGENELFDPEPNPVLVTDLVDSDEKEFKFRIEVKEADFGRDDTFIKQEIKYPLAEMSTPVVLKDKKNRCTLTLQIKIQEVEKW